MFNVYYSPMIFFSECRWFLFNGFAERKEVN